MGFTLGVDLAGTRPVLAFGDPGTQPVPERTDGTRPGVVPAPPGHLDASAAPVADPPAPDADAPSHDALPDLLERVGGLDLQHGGRTPPHVELADLVEQCTRAATRTRGARPDAVVVSHPAEWGPYRTDLLAGALADRHLPPFSLVADACAIVRHAVASGRLRLPGPAHVAVLDVREEHTSVAVVAVPVAAPVAARGAASGDGPVLVGAPRLLADLGAADLDDAVLGHVRRVAGAGEADDAPRLDRDSAAALRQACRRAADALLDGAAAVVRYPAPEGPRDVRVVPADLDARLRPRGTRTAGGAAAAVAALVPAGVDAVLLTGRPAALPLLTELVAQRFDAPITALPGDAEAAALGAAATPPGTTAQPSASRRARHRAGAADSDEPRHSRRRAPGSRRGRRRPATAVAGLGVVALGVLAVAVSDDASAADDASRRPAHEVTDERPRTGAVGG